MAWHTAGPGHGLAVRRAMETRRRANSGWCVGQVGRVFLSLTHLSFDLKQLRKQVDECTRIVGCRTQSVAYVGVSDASETSKIFRRCR